MQFTKFNKLSRIIQHGNHQHISNDSLYNKKYVCKQIIQDWNNSLLFHMLCFFFGSSAQLRLIWLGRCLWSFIQVFFIIPITIYNFFLRFVYVFGPKSCRRSFFDILCNPVLGIEFQEILYELDDLETLWSRQFNHNIVVCPVARNIKLNVTQNTRSIAWQFMIALSLISTLMLYKFMGINLILLWMIIQWAREKMRESIACQWCFTLLFAIFVSGCCFLRLTNNTT